MITGRVFWARKMGLHRIRPRRVESVQKSTNLTKRRKFVLVALLLSLYLYIVQSLSVELRFLAIALLSVISFVLSAWALVKELRGYAWAINLLLPTLYPVAVALFYFLLPQSSLTRMLVIALFAISMYALLLTANIFAVASIRTIQLLRAARTVGFLLTVVTSALLYHVVFTLKLPFYLVTLAVVFISALVFVQGLWSYTLAEKLSREELLPALIGVLVTAQCAMALSFWLIEAPFASILLAMIVYVLLGLFQHKLEKRLFARTVSEYLSFAILVLLVVTIAVFYRWVT